MQPGSPPAVGLAHDYLLVMRGAERTFAEIAACWPTAPIHTALYDPEAMPRFAGRDVHTSVLQRTGVRQNGFRRLLPLFPAAVSRMRIDATELVVSSSSAFAHGMRVPEGVPHVCYCYTPFRYAWHERATALREVPAPARPALRLVLDQIRRWDVRVAARVDHYVAISEISRERIAAAFGRDAPIVHPPVEVERFTPTAGGEHLLVVCELVSHKRVELALEAAQRAGWPAVVVGTGPEQARLARDFPTARFAGRVSDPELAVLYAQARAVVVPSYEEFGIVAVEAQASGTPVVAPRRGGAAETVLDGVTGVLLDEVSARSIAAALAHEVVAQPDAAALRAQADRFSAATFRRRLVETVEELTGRPAPAGTVADA
ncbi:glycosyltransferase [Conexibacter sp. W3-3-2]|uniref:glycosyltransferase n=1 Tax=Conexibacter sp. W3-3-2 TaxID=2675227 RepID=UPI0012B9254D|nr:glycosyltransferase [Conexibacter sp. W3-3-2]MTD43062.1 glycosyltransferase [Conexibacter sp. W3-3-2]